MTTHQTSIAFVPAIAGTGLALGAIALLTADAITTGHLTITHAMQPLLVLGTCIAAAWAHRSGWRRPLSALAFASLALLGSVATIYGTMGRQADARDTKVAGAMAENRQLAHRNDDLDTARAVAKAECKSGFGARCTAATQRIDALVASMSSLRTVSTDPRADAIAELLHLIGNIEKSYTRKIVAAVDPIVLPLFLEVGSILFFAAAFPHRKVATVTVSPHTLTVAKEIVSQPFTKADALADLQTLKASGSQQFLALRWGVSEPTVSKWMSTWQATGTIDRNRQGKNVRVLAIAPPQRKRLGKAAVIARFTPPVLSPGAGEGDFHSPMKDLEHLPPLAV